MAATSYTTLPSNAYVGLGSQGELFHSANYGSYDAGIGSITSHPYQYQTTNHGTYLMDHQQPLSYSNDLLRSTHAHGVYSTQEPQYYSTDRYTQQSTYNQDPPLNDYNHSQVQRYNTNDRSTIPNNNTNGNYTIATINTTQPPIDNHQHHVESNPQHQISHTDTIKHPPVSIENQPHQSQMNQDSSNHPSVPKQPQQQRHQAQPNNGRSDRQTSKPPPLVPYRSPSDSNNDPPSATVTKTTNLPRETKTTKSNQMRAAAIKKKEEAREQKRRDGNFPSLKKKSAPPKSESKSKSVAPSPSDDERNEKSKPKRNNKQSKSRKSRRDHYQTEDNITSAEEDNHDERHRSKSKKRAAFSDTQREKLPPVRRGRAPPFYDPYYDYPYPPGPPLRGRHPYYDDYPPYGPYPYPGRHDYRHRHLYEDGYDAPPYIAGYNDPYDGFFDYEKRKGHSRTKKHKEKKEATTDHEDRDAITENETEREDDNKSSHTKKSKNHKNSNKDKDENGNGNDDQRWHYPYYDAPHYDDRYALEIWRQERNDYLKKKFKPTVHDVLYSQQFLKSDSYVENQRRRAVRDAQGYYFPYKKYTLKDYRDLQKQEANHNPYAAVDEPPLDRKARAKKRQEYAAQIERQTIDISGGNQKIPRDMPPRKPWHLSNGEVTDPDALSKRERALEYAKVQVVKKQPTDASKNRSHQVDPTEQYVNSLFPQVNDDEEDSINEEDHRSNNEDD